jgi:hypothetical protein
MRTAIRKSIGVHVDQCIARIRSDLCGVGAEECGRIDLGVELVVRVTPGVCRPNPQIKLKVGGSGWNGDGLR